MFQFSCRFAFLINFSSFKSESPKITPILTLYPVNAATLMLFSKEDKNLIKNLYECKGYNTQKLIIEFPDKGWTKNSINGEV